MFLISYYPTLGEAMVAQFQSFQLESHYSSEGIGQHYSPSSFYLKIDDKHLEGS